MMKSLSVFFALLFVISCSEQGPAPMIVPPTQGEIVFRNVNVIPMDSARVLENQVVVAKNGVIAAIGDADSISWSSDALVIDAAGKYLMPGLAEMHAHMPPVDDLAPMREVLALFALNGVTTIRGMLGHPKHLELREKIQAGEIFGPRFYTAGPPLEGHEIKTPEEAASVVREQKRAGYDFLKVLMPGLSKASFDAMAATAKELDMPFAGHVPFEVGVWRAIEAGYASIDHMDGFVEGLIPGIENMTFDETGLFGMFVADKADTSQIPRLINALREGHIWVVPTQSLAERWFSADKTAEQFLDAPEMVYMKSGELKKWTDSKNGITSDPKYNPSVIRQWNEIRKRLIRECNKSGVGLLLGSDAPQVFNVPGFSTHHELQYLVDAGLTPYEALRTGTVNVGRYFKRDDIGIVKTGALSDLILLNGNPLTDISQTRNIEGVLLGNRWLPKNLIEATLKNLAKK